MSPEITTAQYRFAEPWGGEHRLVDLDGEVHFIDFGGDDDGVPVVLVHGLGGMAVNWVLLAPLLRDQGHHVYAVDLAGHGLTRAIDRSPSVGNNAKLVRQFIEQVVGRPVVLMGNSMGGLIVSMVASRHPELVSGLVLLNPAMPSPMKYAAKQASSLRTLVSTPMSGIISRMRKRPMTPEAEVGMLMGLCFYDFDQRDEAMFDAHVDIVKLRHKFPESLSSLGIAGRTMIQATISHRTVMERYRSIKAPVLLIHGTHDRLVDVVAARWAKRGNRDWTYLEWDDTGHVPMMEHPQRTAESINDWLTAHVAAVA